MDEREAHADRRLTYDRANGTAGGRVALASRAYLRALQRPLSTHFAQERELQAIRAAGNELIGLNGDTSSSKARSQLWRADVQSRRDALDANVPRKVKESEVAPHGLCHSHNAPPLRVPSVGLLMS
jgi:hypothetical protein